MSNAKKIAWITGASSGIGRALALKMAHKGYHVVASARRLEALEELAAEAAALSGAITPMAVDTTLPEQVNQTVSRIETEIGSIDVAVFCAGTYEKLLAHEVTLARARPVYELNLMGTLACFEAVLPGMRARKQGRIAMVASLAGYFGLPTSAIYGASKAAIINMAEALQPELKLQGITLQIVNPGFVKTPLTAKNDFPMPFLMEVEDAADAFLEGLESDRFEITFPRRFSLILRLLQTLPYGLALWLTGKTVPKEAKTI
ncbi:MAG: SDR family NAD(P)-dependent oxidoreductase [Rhizobiales bacterium]|nr:SDR family NAD(P)-dependent oxidoreductase [Hyphomicrobiales bacterium]